MKTNRILHGDCLEVLRDLPMACANLVYLDPPFNTNRTLTGKVGAEFGDSWVSADLQNEIKILTNTAASTYALIQSIAVVGEKGIGNYLIFIAARVQLIRRVMAANASLFLHCDWHAAHYLKIILDSIMGVGNFKNNIVWCYTGPASNKNQYPRKHDTILFYTAGKGHVFNPDAVRVPYKDANQNLNPSYGTKRVSPELIDFYRKRGKIIEDWWADIGIAPRSPKERVGYPTQKPLDLMVRIIKGSSNEGDLILDPFCGSGTACVAAIQMGRKFIGIDESADAVKIARRRVKQARGLFTDDQ